MKRRYRFNIKATVSASSYDEALELAIMAIDSSDLREQDEIVDIELHHPRSDNDDYEYEDDIYDSELDDDEYFSDY